MGRAVAMGAGFVVAHVAAAAAGGTWWGLHHLRYLDPVSIAIAAACAGIAAAAAVVPATRWPIVGRLPPSARTVLLVAALGSAFWMLRDRTHLLGDGLVILDASAAPGWVVWSEREPLAHLVGFLLHRAAGRLDVPTATVFEIWSCLLGMLLVALLARADRAAGMSGWLLALALTTGAVQLFFGYVEYYPALAVVLVAMLFALRRPAETRATLLPGLLLFALALYLHISAVVFLPALAWGVLRQVRLRSGSDRVIVAVEVAGAAVAAAVAWEVVFRSVAGAPSVGGYVAILARSVAFVDPGAVDASAVTTPLLSLGRLRDVLQLWILLVPVALPLAVRGVARVGRRGLLARPSDMTLAIAAGAGLAAQILFSPQLGAPRDWDVLAFAAFPVAMLAASLTRDALGPGAKALAIGLATFHVAAWIAVNASPAAARVRFEEVPLTAGQADFVLGTRALREGDVAEAAAHFEQVVHDVPATCPGWFSLGLAREQLGDFAAAREAFARALANQERDRRVPRGEILERLGRASWETGRADEARRAFRLAHEERPESLPPVLFLAVTASREGRPDEVLRLLDPFLARRAEQPAILMLTADALDALGREEEARARRLEAVRLFPDDPNVRATLERRPAEENR